MDRLPYDGLRHWIFALAAFCILGGALPSGIESLLDVSPISIQGRIAKASKGLVVFVVLVVSIVTTLDYAAISPYSYAYMNEMSRLRLNHSDTELDYWGIASKPIAEEINSRQWPVSNLLDDGAADHIYYRKRFLDDSYPSSSTHKEALIHRRFKTQSKRLAGFNCQDQFSITDQLFLGKPLILARVGFDCRSKND